MLINQSLHYIAKQAFLGTRQFSSNPGIKIQRKDDALPSCGSQNEISNVYHYLKKGLHSVDELVANVSVLDDDKRCIGSLPVEWLNGFKTGNIGENTRKVFEIFSKFAKETSNMPAYEGINDGDDEKYRKLVGRFPNRILKPEEKWLNEIEKLENSLEEVFKDKPEVSYLSCGSFGLAFKVKINDKTCVLKTYFFDGYSKEKDITGHGAASEIANAVYLNRTLKPSQCSKFYCAKIPAADAQDGFLNTEYVDGSKNSLPASEQRMDWFMREKPYWGRLTFCDCHNDNFSNGKLIDYGAIEYTFKNRKTLELAKKLIASVVQGDIAKLKAIKDEYGKTSEFMECVEHLWIYSGEMETDNPEAFAEHCVNYNITRKMIDGFRALGADYGNIEACDFSSIVDLELRKKLEELFS